MSPSTRWWWVRYGRCCNEARGLGAKRFFLTVDVNNELGIISEEEQCAGASVVRSFFMEAARLTWRAMGKILREWMLWKTVGVVRLPPG